MKIKVGVLGNGEVGNSMAQFYADNQSYALYIQDLKQQLSFGDNILDILHVCIPWSENFINIVLDVLGTNASDDTVVVIHSSVPVGTTEVIGSAHQHTVHSPVRGVHPNIHEGIKTFVKFIGADFAATGKFVSDHFDSLNIPNAVVRKSRTTELMKLLDTTYYGICIAYHAYADKLCKELGVPFSVVMEDANLTYNGGYVQLGKANVVRPVLYSPENGKIGGHCVIPNADILRETMGDDPILQAILRHK